MGRSHYDEYDDVDGDLPEPWDHGVVEPMRKNAGKDTLGKIVGLGILCFSMLGMLYWLSISGTMHKIGADVIGPALFRSTMTKQPKKQSYPEQVEALVSHIIASDRCAPFVESLREFGNDPAPSENTERTLAKVFAFAKEYGCVPQ
jgi:hypothetical protein